MIGTPEFFAEVSLSYQKATGLKIECPENIAANISRFLAAANFKFNDPKVTIYGGGDIHNLVGIDVSGNRFKAMKKAISDGLINSGTIVLEEDFSSAHQKNSRLNLARI